MGLEFEKICCKTSGATELCSCVFVCVFVGLLACVICVHLQIERCFNYPNIAYLYCKWTTDKACLLALTTGHKLEVWKLWNPQE